MQQSRGPAAYQKELFLTSVEEDWEVEDQERPLAEIVFNRPLDTIFHYLIPESLTESIQVGKRVLVPLGRGNHVAAGYCVGVHYAVPKRKLKPISKILDDQVLLRPEMLKLTRWMASYYLCSWGQALNAVLPAGVRNQAGAQTIKVLQACQTEDSDLLGLTTKQKRAFEILQQSSRPLTPAELKSSAQCGDSPLRALRQRGIIEAVEQPLYHKPTIHQNPENGQKSFDLTTDQRSGLKIILDALEQQRHQTILLHGVTGSGKTEVYIRAIQEVISYGRQAIVIVPEISLTPQTIQRFRERFSAVAVLHSHLSDKDRHQHWQQIAEGSVQVVVGARSAVFAPTPHLGIIVLDEEHETTFKQETTPRYHAREVAQQRTKLAEVPLLLGSATPSLEAWQAASDKRYQLVSLPRRVMDLPMPVVQTLDMRQRVRERRGMHALSLALETAMQQSLENKGQVILLLNRRGYSTHIQCPRCGEPITCQRCDISLIHHKQKNAAICHYCDFETQPPEICPHCQFPGMRYQGIGTERLESEIRSKFPDVRSVRMDTDTMRSPGNYEKALTAFREGSARILLGTQMIAKGLDFPQVTLVGVINADTALHLPDFRASERTFQLVAQVAGRTGRGPLGGRVLVQTFSPDHPAIVAAASHDFIRFADQELTHRKEYGYPPYGNMARIIIRGTDETSVESFAEKLAEDLACQDSSTAVNNWRVLGPAPCPIGRIQNHYRFHLQLQTSLSGSLQDYLREHLQSLRIPSNVDFQIDIDPLSML